MVSQLEERKSIWNSEDLKMYLFLFILTATSLNYFYATFLPGSFKALRLVYLTGCVIFGMYFFNSYKGEFALPVKLLSLSMIFSIFISYISWNQPVHLGALITMPFLLWPIYFLLFRLRISVALLENVILIFGLLYIFLYFYQYLNPSKVLFATNSVSVKDGEFVESRGVIRILFPGVGVFWLAVYIALVRLTQQGFKYKFIWGGIVLLGLLIPVMQVTRSLIVPTALVFAFHFFKHTNFSKKLLFGALAVMVGAFFIDLAIPAIEGMLEAQEKNMEEGSKYVRLLAAKYFLVDFPPSILNHIFGNGMGHERAEYGQYLRRLMEHGYFISDIGIIGVFTYFGIFFIIGWVLIYYKVYTLKIDPKYIYVKYYFFNVLFGAITGSSLYHPGGLMSSIFAVYIFQKVLKEKRLKLIKKLILEYKKEKEVKDKLKTEVV